MHKRALGLVVAAIVGVVLISASGALATTNAQPATKNAQTVAKVDVSTRAAVVDYLRSIHVNAKHAVIQRGLRNYAGARCPGAHWTCAGTGHTVVQIAKRGGQNRFLCKGSKCVVVQISGAPHGVYAAGRLSAAAPNKQQGGGTNTAGIYEVTSKVAGLVQTVQWAASIQQTDGTNIACVTQGITQDGSASNTNGRAVNVSLEATQSLTITQNTLTGDNTATNGADPTTGHCTSQTLAQSQTQTSTVSATGDITQTMNPSVVGLTGGNVSLDIEQNQDQVHGYKGNATGANHAVFSQTTNQTAIANAKNLKHVTQTENAPDGDGTTTAFSGIVGTINQDSKGVSTATVTQDETQCEDAANTSPSHDAPLTQCAITTDAQAPSDITLTQTENGPVGMFTPAAKSASPVHYNHKGTGTSQQTGAAPHVVDSFILHQFSHQYTDPSGPGITLNQVNTMQGDCASSGDGSATGGSCLATQKATLNSANGSGDTQDGYTAGSINNLLISCGNGHNSCTATPPPTPMLIAHPPVDLNGDTTATSASFEFTDPAQTAHFNCTLDTSTVTPCGSPSINSDNLLDGTKSYSGLTLGPHIFSVTATDPSGNTSNKPPLATFTWTVVPPCTIGAGNSPLAYSSMPSDVVNCGPASEGFEANSDNEFGNEVALSTAGGTNLASMSVDFQSYGCSVSGHWYTGDCVSSTNDTFTIPDGITATIYSVGAGDTVGPVIATSTANPNIPYRPSADNTNCTGGDVGKWYDPIAAACRNSYPDVITFSNWNFPNGSHTFANAEKVIWTVKFNTTHAGYTPIGENTDCFASAVGCGYDSLNVGAKTYTNAAAWPSLTTAPYAGTDVDEDVAFRSYDDPGYSGTVIPLAMETGWTGFRPLGKIVLAP